jgi:ABC-type Na+ efflux pump permease subunit
MSLVRQQSTIVSQIGDIVGTLPDAIQQNIQGDSPTARASYAFAVYLLAPIAIVVPLTISSAVGANSIVGERERGTGEFLAHSPLTVREIYMGKLIASLLPGYAAGIIGFGLYSIVVNVIVGSQIGGWFFPTAGWLLLVLWVVPPFIAIALALILRLSARVRSAASAHQASSLVTLPVILMSYVVASGLLYSPVLSAAGAGLVAWLVAFTLLASGARSIKRERLLGVSAEA